VGIFFLCQKAGKREEFPYLHLSQKKESIKLDIDPSEASWTVRGKEGPVHFPTKKGKEGGHLIRRGSIYIVGSEILEEGLFWWHWG